MRLDGAALCGLCEPLLRESATSGRAKFVKIRHIACGHDPVSFDRAAILSHPGPRGHPAIWALHVAAAEAQRTGHRHSAAAILEIAEAVEQEALFANKRLRGHLADVTASLNRV